MSSGAHIQYLRQVRRLQHLLEQRYASTAWVKLSQPRGKQSPPDCPTFPGPASNSHQSSATSAPTSSRPVVTFLHGNLIMQQENMFPAPCRGTTCLSFSLSHRNHISPASRFCYKGLTSTPPSCVPPFLASASLSSQFPGSLSVPGSGHVWGTWSPFLPERCRLHLSTVTP